MWGLAAGMHREQRWLTVCGEPGVRRSQPAWITTIITSITVLFNHSLDSAPITFFVFASVKQRLNFFYIWSTNISIADDKSKALLLFITLLCWMFFLFDWLFLSNCRITDRCYMDTISERRIECTATRSLSCDPRQGYAEPRHKANMQGFGFIHSLKRMANHSLFKVNFESSIVSI